MAIAVQSGPKLMDAFCLTEIMLDAMNTPQCAIPTSAADMAIARRVDLLILGGSAAAVACGLAAARAGRSVLIAAPLHGLADDIAETWRLEPGATCNDALSASIFADGRCPTPLHARRVCEDAVLEAEIDLLLGALPCGALRDEHGALRGALLAHRGGRSAVVASHVVDAGWTASFARDAGIAFTKWEAGPIMVESRLLLPNGVVGEGEDLGEVALPVDADSGKQSEAENDGAATVRLWRRLDALQLPTAQAADLCALEAQRQLRAFDARAHALSPWGFYVPPVALAGDPVSEWHGAGDLPLDICAAGEGLSVLSGAVRVSRKLAGELLAPAALCQLGERLGQHLASLPLATSPALQGGLSGAAHGLAVRGGRGGLRPQDANLPTVAVDDSQAPLLATVEVAVIGGGTGGAPAGIAAAREGAQTLVLERLQRLGGVGTLGRIGHYWFGNRVGFTAEVDDLVFGGYGEPRFPKQKGAWWVLEHKQDAWLRLLDQAGGRCWFGSAAVAALLDGDQVCGALLATLHGAGVVRAAAWVDASGCADLAAAAGAPCRVTDDSSVAVQGSGLPAVDPRKDYQNSDHDFCDDSDAVDVTRFHLRARHKFAQAWDTAPLIDSRERRQIRGVYEITPLDICSDRGFEDAVVRAKSNFDSHGFTVHPVFLAYPMDKKPMAAWLPYRALLPQGIDGVLVTGLGMSAHRDALPVLRMQPDVQNAGYSAGVAAAMAAGRGCGTASLPVPELQRRLVELGHLDPAALDVRDTFPIPEADLAVMINDALHELRSISAAFAAGQAAWPLLRAALDDEQRQETAAIILGLQGDDQAAPVLRALLADGQWDEGWRFTGMGQFGRSLSPVDTRLVALAHCGEAGDAEAVIRLAGAVAADPELSHCRALAWAASTIAARHPTTAERLSAALVAVLGLPGLAGHAWTTLDRALAGADDNTINTREREEALRELHLAVALWRCGDRHTAEPMLRAYASDLRGHYARHAAAVMQAGKL